MLSATAAERFDKRSTDLKKTAAAVKRNEVAMAYFSMAFVAEGVMGLVYKASTNEWPSGSAALVVKELLKKYVVVVSSVEVRLRSNKVT